MIFDINRISLIRHVYFCWRYLFPLEDPLKAAKYCNSVELKLTPYKALKTFYQEQIGNINRVNGAFVHLEFGVYNGTSLASALNTQRSLELTDTKVIAFDSFQGLPKESEYEDHFQWQEGMYRCDKLSTLNNMKKLGVTNFESISFVEGWFKDTLNQEQRDLQSLSRFDVAFVDCDTYSSCKQVLAFLSPLIKGPSLLCFDDWKLKNLDLSFGGESKAFSEFLTENSDITVREVKSYCRKARCFLVSRERS